MLRWIAEQASTDPSALEGYAERDQIRRENFIELLHPLFESLAIFSEGSGELRTPRHEGNCAPITLDFIDDKCEDPRFFILL